MNCKMLFDVSAHDFCTMSGFVTWGGQIYATSSGKRSGSCHLNRASATSTQHLSLSVSIPLSTLVHTCLTGLQDIKATTTTLKSGTACHLAATDILASPALSPRWYLAGTPQTSRLCLNAICLTAAVFLGAYYYLRGLVTYFSRSPATTTACDSDTGLLERWRGRVFLKMNLRISQLGMYVAPTILCELPRCGWTLAVWGWWWWFFQWVFFPRLLQQLVQTFLFDRILN